MALLIAPRYNHPVSVEALPQSGQGKKSRLSFSYMTMPKASCLLLFTQVMRMALALALDRAGKSMAARIAMMAMTTNSSIRVKPRFTAPADWIFWIFISRILGFLCFLWWLQKPLYRTRVNWLILKFNIWRPRASISHRSEERRVGKECRSR